MTEAGAGHRSGFVGIIGRPNVGKSTILNYYLGEKISIVSSKPQTTRHRVLGVLTREDAQVMFLDTPGLCTPQHTLGRYMQEAAKSVIDEADVLVAVIDGRVGVREDDERLFARLRPLDSGPGLGRGALARDVAPDVSRGRPERSRGTTQWSPGLARGAPQALSGGRAGNRAKQHCLLAINKVDVAKKPRLLPLLEMCAKTKLFEECIPVSALKGDQMDVLLACIISRLPQGPQWYEPQDRTDQTSIQLIAELVREQILLATRQEVPHTVAVLVEEVVEQERVTLVRATILVERPGQKAIVIGRQGLMLKRIGQHARGELERYLGRKVHLELWVKVAAGWRNDPRVLRELGYSA